MPDNKERFHLYSDTSKFATGSTLYHIQKGHTRLKAYASKRIPTATQKYSINELELGGLAINIASFSHFLKRVDFDAVVDHVSLTHTMKSKSEPATNRIKRLLEGLSLYSFNLCFLESKGMVLRDFLTRMEGEKSYPLKVSPSFFNSHSIMTGHYYTHFKLQSETYTVVRLMTHIAQIRSVFDVANLQQYHAGFAPMLFQWSHAHIVCFFVAKNRVIKRGLEQKNCTIKKSHSVCHGTNQVQDLSSTDTNTKGAWNRYSSGSST